MSALPKPKKDAVIFEDDKLYACLASYPIVRGHTVIVWKKKVADLHLLSKEDYEHLMDCVDLVRNSLLKTLKIEKVYLLYMDEARQVHWHLIPRFDEKGYNVFRHRPTLLKDYSLAKEIKRNVGR